MTNEILAHRLLQELIKKGVLEFCVCPGARNSPFVHVLNQNKQVQQYFWFEERSAAFFALGRMKATGRPVAVITTSGTAVGELLPAVMESYYGGFPLVLITADRPRRFRGSGAPQTAEQVGIFGLYAPFQLDLEKPEIFSLEMWKQDLPAHLNVCFEEPVSQAEPLLLLSSTQDLRPSIAASLSYEQSEMAALAGFLEEVRYPLVVVGEVGESARTDLALFLNRLHAPIFLEGLSGLRENPLLQDLRITRTDNLWQNASQNGYPIDSIVRIGGIPTFRLWRDLEEKQSQIKVYSISSQPFSGLSWGEVHCASLSTFFKNRYVAKVFDRSNSEKWRRADCAFAEKMRALFFEEPLAEPSLIHQLSRFIPAHARIYLGNSLPIREWDLAATHEDRGFMMGASRGLNGIDGQISTFLGFSQEEKENWAILGDLTTLYDMAGPWILSQLNVDVNIVVINNGGGQIFSRMFSNKEFLHEHKISFEPLAAMWQMHYEKWQILPFKISSNRKKGNRMIEIIPCQASTQRFWQKFSQI